MTALMPMSTIQSFADQEERIDEAELAAAAFLARYQGRTLDAYRYDLRAFFQWAADEGLLILSATRPQIELYVRAMEGRGLAATTMDRRLSTVCGFYRFAHIDGRIASNPAQYVRRPKVHPNDACGLDRSELRSFVFAADRVDHAHAALAVLLGLNGLRVSEACSADIENLGSERGHRTLRIVGKGNKPAVIPLVPRTARTSTWQSGNVPRGRSCSATTAGGLTGAPLTGGTARLSSEPGSATCTPTCCVRRSSCAPSRRESHCEKFRSPPVMPTRERRPSTTGRQSFERHAAYVVVAFVTGG